MITSVQFKNFRAFDDLRVEPLKRVTLIAGQNNTGKTSVLEGIYLAALRLEGNPAGLPRLFRVQPGKQPSGPDDFQGFWSWLFRDRSTTNPANIVLLDERKRELEIEIRADATNGTQANTIKIFQFEQASNVVRPAQPTNPPLITLQESGIVNQTFAGTRKIPTVGVLSVQPGDPTAIAELFNLAAQERDGESKIETLMREIEPKTQRLRYSKPPRTFHPLVYCDVGLPRAIPSMQMGEGFARVLAIYCQILVSKLDILLIDEIENGIHFSVLPAFWRGLIRVAETENVQIVATTHSWECVQAAYKASNEKNDNSFQYLRLDRVKEHIKCTAVDGPAMEIALTQGWEMR